MLAILISLHNIPTVYCLNIFVVFYVKQNYAEKKKNSKTVVAVEVEVLS